MGAFSKLQAVLFVSLLTKPFKKWEAYKLGIIDEKGVKIKEPKTKEEKDSIDLFKNMIRKIKVTLLKFIPSEKYLQFILAAYLLKENLDERESVIKIELNKVLSEEEQMNVFEIISDPIIH